MTEDARAYGLRLLGQRAYATRDFRRKLVNKEFTLEEIETTIARFIESGLLDDRKFAVNFSRSKLTTSSTSPRRVRQHLARKGIASAIAAEAVDQVILEEEIDTNVNLEKVAGKKLAALSGLDSHVQRRRLYGFLARRGYEVEEIRRTVEKLIGEGTTEQAG